MRRAQHGDGAAGVVQAAASGVAIAQIELDHTQVRARPGQAENRAVPTSPVRW